MKTMRRKDREKSKEFALDVVDKCAYAVIATVNEDGSPYCIPLSIARDGEWLYFHSALEGHKIENLRREPRVCITVVGDVKIIPRKFGIEFESAVINGTAAEVLTQEEKTQALAVICKRYVPADMDIFGEAVRKDIEQTGIWKIHINEISGKGRKL